MKSFIVWETQVYIFFNPKPVDKIMCRHEFIISKTLKIQCKSLDQLFKQRLLDELQKLKLKRA